MRSNVLTRWLKRRSYVILTEEAVSQLPNDVFDSICHSGRDPESIAFWVRQDSGCRMRPI